MAVVAIILFLVVFFTKNTWVEYLGGLAVLLTFGHSTISERFREREAAKSKPSVECVQKTLYYFIGKELCWTVYFLQTKSYSALVGVGIFLLYPVWRKFWRRIHPLETVPIDIP
jgi:hypothetical protein